MFLCVNRLLFAASLLASDNSTILCSRDLILESIALIIWKKGILYQYGLAVAAKLDSDEPWVSQDA